MMVMVVMIMVVVAVITKTYFSYYVIATILNYEVGSINSHQSPGDIIMDSLCIGNQTLSWIVYAWETRVAGQLGLCHTAHHQSRVMARYQLSYHLQVYKV